VFSADFVEAELAVS